jgi:hypothetical protein
MTSTIKTGVTMDTTALLDGQTADANDVITPLDDLLAHVKNGRVSITANDTHVKHLNDALTVSTGLSKAVGSPAGDETLGLSLDSKFVNLLALLPASGKIQDGAIDSETANSGYVLTANGSGGVSWAAAGGGGAQPVDLSITAGENLSERDLAYLNTSDNKWYKIDTNASPPKVGYLRGVINQSGGILADNTGTVRVLGEVSGFTSLTAWGPVYASTTAGGYTQTKPTVSAGGGQVALVTIGFATSTTTVMVWQRPIQYLKRESLANNATTTIEHHEDALARERQLRAYIAGSDAGATLTSYADTNRDDRASLRGFAGAGGTTTITASGGGSTRIGDTGGTEYELGQSFQVTAGKLTQFTFTLLANAGSPSGNLTWEIRSDAAGAPSTVLQTGTITPTGSTTNTVNITDGVYLAASTTYWLVLRGAAQANDTGWEWQRSATSVYASGQGAYRDLAGGSWTGLPSNDHQITVTTGAVVARDKLAQSFQIGSTADVDSVRLWIKKVGSPTGTMTCRIETDSAGNPSGTLANANATVTVAESGLTTSYGWIEFDFATNFSLTGSTTYWIVLSTDRSASNTNYVDWGSDQSSPSYANGQMKGEASSTWSALSMDACFEVLAPDTVYEEQCVVGRWSGGTRDIAVRMDDGAGANGSTKTTFKNTSGGTLDTTCIVELA